MKIVERLGRLKELVTFTKDDFIFVQILKRRKDNPEMELGVKRIKSYSFYSWEELIEQAPRIEELCDLNNARAYIRLNKQNAVDMTLTMIKELADNISNDRARQSQSIWDSLAGKGGAKDWWVLDLDEEHLDIRLSLVDDISKSFQMRKDSFFGQIITFNWTKSGVHLICKPFDVRVLEKYNKDLSSKGLPVIQIQKDANTVLYIGNGK